MSTITNQTLENVCVKSAESGALECFDQLRIVVDQSASSLDVLVIIFSLTASVVIGFLSVFLAFWGFKISKQAVESAREAAGIAEKANELAASEAEANRKYNQLSVRPYLTYEIHFTEGKSLYRIFIYNKGLGPALIKNFGILTKSGEKILKENGLNELENLLKNKIDGNLQCPQDALIEESDSCKVKMDCLSLDGDVAIASGDKYTLLQLNFIGYKFNYDWVTPFLANVMDFEIVYTDFHNEFNGSLCSKKTPLDTSITKN